MSLARGRFGIEYNPVPRRRNESSGAGWVLLAVLLVAAVSFVVHAVRRPAASPEEYPPAPRPAQARPAASPEGPAARPAPPAAEGPAAQGAPAEAGAAGEGIGATAPAGTNSVQASSGQTPAQGGQAEPPPPPIAGETINRPPRVKNLLLRLNEAEKQGNVEMAVSTIQQLRSLPGEPAADLDDRLARRLGALNAKWLFERANKQWVTEVAVRQGDSASRIAAAHGSTLASLVRLNGLKNADNLQHGKTVKVMNHPRFSLTVHRRARYADLHLNGKFFNRYDLTEDVKAEIGVREVDTNARAAFKQLGLHFSVRDGVELETLIPRGATIAVSET